MSHMPDMDAFIKSRDVQDIPQDHLLDVATTCSWESLRLHAKTVLIRKAIREGLLENTEEIANANTR